MSLYFGPFYDRSTGAATLRWIKQLVKKAYYHGPIDRAEAEKRLAGQSDGTFLIRVSNNKADHPLTLSLQRKGVQHKRIKHVYGSGGWFAPTDDGKTVEFASLWELIDAPAMKLGSAAPTEVEAESAYIYET